MYLDLITYIKQASLARVKVQATLRLYLLPIDIPVVEEQSAW